MILNLVLQLLTVSLQAQVCDVSDPTNRAPASAKSCERIFEDVGPRRVVELPGIELADDIGRPQTLRIAHYNLLQFKVQKDTGHPGIEPKPEWATNLIIHQILREDPDVLFLSEVVGEKSFAILSKRLDEKYEPIMIEGNDDFYSVAILIRKTLPFRVAVQSHRGLEHSYGGQTHPIFTRDFLLAQFTYPGDTTPTVSIGGSHFKSRRHSKYEKGFDEGSILKRTEQVRTSIELLKNHERETSTQAMVLLGDFNADIRSSAEMLPFRESGFQEAMQVLGVPQDQRATHSYFYKDRATYAQFDGFFVSDNVVSAGGLISAYVVPDRDKQGVALPAPVSHGEILNKRASDHKMVVLNLDLTKIKAKKKN